MLSELWFIIIATVLVNNLVLTQFLGIDPAFNATRSLRPTLLHCAATATVLILTGCALLAIGKIVNPLSSPVALVLVVLVTAAAATLIDRLAQQVSPLDHRALGHHLPLLFSNSAVLGTGLTLHAGERGIILQMAFLLATVLAFTLVMVLLASARERLAGADVPAAFEGVVITVMTLGLLSLAFTGFTGMAGA